MENNQPGNYQLPANIADDASAEDAGRALRQFQNDIRDPQHPFWDPNNPQAQDWSAYQRKLYQAQVRHEAISEGRDPDEPPPTSLQRAMAEGLKAQEQQQKGWFDRGETAMERLVDLGFEPADIPDDLVEPEVTALEIQVALAENKIGEAEMRFRQAVTQLPAAPAYLWDGFNTAKQLPDGEAKVALWHQLLIDLANAGRAKLGLKPRTIQEAGDDE